MQLSANKRFIKKLRHWTLRFHGIHTLFVGTESLGNEFKRSGHIFTNNEKYIVLNVAEHTLKEAVLYHKIVCRKEECL
ncbi:MAG: hypothetical protein ACI4PK_00680 [Oscillospiraceae bacterium]